jgi:kinetochore protein Spc25
MADSLPGINFGFDELRERMAKFTHRFDDFIAEGRKRVLEERNQFHMSVAELHGKLPRHYSRGNAHQTAEDQKMKKRDIEILTHKASTHTQTLAKEAAETAEMREAITSISGQRDARSAHRDEVRTEITSIQKAIDQRLEAQRHHAQHLSAQARFNNPELDFWTDYLCLRIEGAGAVDRLKFVFTHVDEKNWEREAWFELCTEKRDYEVIGCKPKIESEMVESCLERLNENRDLGTFLKGMRELFVEAMK